MFVPVDTGILKNVVTCYHPPHHRRETTSFSGCTRLLTMRQFDFRVLLLLLFFVVVIVDSSLSSIDNSLFEALRSDDVIAASAALKDGANINAISPKGGQTPLMQSVLHGRVEMVRWCLENGADTTIAEKDGYTPMHGAAFQGHAYIVRLLLEHGVALRDVHKDGFEPASE